MEVEDFAEAEAFVTDLVAEVERAFWRGVGEGFGRGGLDGAVDGFDGGDRRAGRN